jgi:hypothetical protein
MGRRVLAFLASIASIPAASAQITSGGYYGNQGVFDLISHLLGIDIHEPYQVLGITATIGVMWVSTYVIFKIGIKKIDEDVGDGYGSPFAEALGIDNSDDRNILAVLTLLVVLTMMGTGAFAGLISGWQSLIILAFTLALLAGLIFLLIGGTGGIIGGTAYTAGASAQVTAEGVDQLRDGLQDIRDLENDVDRQEDEEEDDIDDGDDDEADEEAQYTEQELEEILNALENAMDDLGDLTAEEIRELGDAIENLEEIIDLLDLED